LELNDEIYEIELSVYSLIDSINSTKLGAQETSRDNAPAPVCTRIVKRAIAMIAHSDTKQIKTKPYLEIA
jgi:hypothetical protein